jgi:hypothetical protein
MAENLVQGMVSLSTVLISGSVHTYPDSFGCTCGQGLRGNEMSLIQRIRAN